MPVHKARARLRWRGAETVREIAKRLARREPVLVLLPAGLHHAVCVRAGADERAHGLIDAALDVRSFERITRINGLRELAVLRDALERGSISVRVRTPPPQLLFSAAEKRPRRVAHPHHWTSAAAIA